MKVKTKNNVILWLLAFLLMTVAFSFNAKEEKAYADDSATTTCVAKIGDTEYSTLTDAITKASASDEIVMQSDVTENITITSEQTITLDLNGYTLTNNGSSDTITNQGTLDIIDSSAAKTGTVDNVTHAYGALVNYPDATATLDGGTFVRSKETGTKDSSNMNSWYVIKNMGTLDINSGTTVKMEVSDCSSMIDNGWYDQKNPTTNDRSQSSTGKTAILTISGGNFIGGLNTIKNDDLGYLTIYGGTFKKQDQAIVQNNNVATITGGTFDGSEMIECDDDHNRGLIENKPYAGTANKGILTITGGTFIAGNSDFNVITYIEGSTNLTSDKVIITGGTFTVGESTLFSIQKTGDNYSPTIYTYGGKYDIKVPSEYCKSGYYPTDNPDEDGLYTVVTEAGKTYGVTVTAPAFSTVTYGYAQPAAKAVSFDLNGGNTTATISGVTISGSDFILAGDAESGYTVQPKKGLTAGTHKATITATYNGDKTATSTVSLKVNKAAQKLSGGTWTKTVKAKKSTKKLAASKSFSIKASGLEKAKVSYKISSGSKTAKKYVKVSSSGKVTVKKGLKKGTYKLKIKTTVGATKNYAAKSFTKTITVKVK